VYSSNFSRPNSAIWDRRDLFCSHTLIPLIPGRIRGDHDAFSAVAIGPVHAHAGM